MADVRTVRISHLALVLLFLSGSSFGQPAAQPKPRLEWEHAESLLASPSLKDKAWGAYWAGRLHQTTLNQLLLNAFADARVYSEAAYGSEERAYVYALFDALIEAGVPVPAETLVPFDVAWRDEVLILLGREQNNEDLLMEMRAAEHGQSQWLTINNYLFTMHSSKWFTQVLEEAPITHTFVVADESGVGYGGGVGGGFAGDGMIEFPADFPPIAIYTLTNTSTEGNVLVSQGPHPTYYRRTVVPTNRLVGFGSSGGTLDRGQCLIDYLAAITPMTPEQSTNLFSPRDVVVWSDSATLTGEASAALQSQVFAIRNYVLTSSRSQFRLLNRVQMKITPVIQDVRTDKTTPLPAIAPVEFSVDPGPDTEAEQ